MSWEDRFSTMVKESSAKIDEAKRRLHSFDISRTPTSRNGNISSVLPPPSFQSTPHARTNQATSLHSNRANGLDDSFFTLHQPHGTSSAALLHRLCEKVERQSQEFDLLKSKVETMEIELNNQQNEMRQVKERLSQIVRRVESFDSETDKTSLKEFKNEVRCELSKIKDCIPDKKDENDETRFNTMTSERFGHVTESSQVVNSLEKIKTRLDKIESNLSSSQLNVENNSERIEMNTTSISVLKNENMESMDQLCKLQDLSVDEVKHLRSKFYDVQDKIHDLETSVNDVRLNNQFTSKRKPNRFLDDEYDDDDDDDDDDVISRVSHSNISISSDEDERNSLTTSSVNLDASDHGDLSFEINEFSLDGNNKPGAKSKNSGSDSFHSSLNSLTGSEDSLSEI